MRCSRPAPWPSWPRCGASWRRRPAPPSAWPSCWRSRPEIAVRRGPSRMPCPPRGTVSLPRRALRLSLAARRLRAQRRQLRGRARRDRGHRRPVGRRQEHDLQPAAALLRPAVGHGARSTASPTAEADLAARCAPASRWCRRTAPCSTTPSPRTSATAGPTPADDEVERAAAAAHADAFIAALPAGLRHPPRRARRHAVGRPAPAHRARPRHPARRPHPAARRGHQRARCRERGRRAEGAGAHHGQTAPRSSSPTAWRPCSAPPASW